MLAYTVTPNAINLFMGGKPWTIDKSHINYGAIQAHLKEHPPAWERSDAVWLDELHELLDVRAFIAKVTEGRVQVSDDTVLFSGRKVHGVIRDRLLAHLSEGYDIHPLARFLDKVMDNPTESSRDDLYAWLEHSKMPITADGDFLAYKYVNNDYSSAYDNTTMHNVGNVVEMPREECDTSRHNTCSSGLHFASFDYMDNRNGSSRMVVLKINPRDVTAIPSDYHNAKGRACRYEVIAEVEQEQKFPPLVSEFGTYDGDAEADAGLYDDDHYDHEGCGCADRCEDAFAPPPIPVRTTYVPIGENHASGGGGGSGGDMEVRSVTGDDRIYDQPLFKHKNGPAFAADDVVVLVKELGQREFARQHNVPRSTLQGWLRKAQAWINKNKRKKK